MKKLILSVICIIFAVNSYAERGIISFLEAQDFVDDFDPVNYCKKVDFKRLNPADFWITVANNNPTLKELARASRADDNADFVNASKEFVKISRRISPYFEFMMDSVPKHPYQQRVDSLVHLMGIKLHYPNVRVKVLEDVENNAYSTPYGEIFISSSMIDAVGDDYCVMAIVAHEMGHYIFQHTLQASWSYYRKIRKKIQAEKITKGICSAIVVATDFYAASHGVDTRNKSTYDLLSQPIDTEKIIDGAMNFKYKFSREQEYESDIIAARFMNLFTEGKSCVLKLLTILDEIEEKSFTQPDNITHQILHNAERVVYDEENTTHPATKSRIKVIKMLDSEQL